MDLNALDIATHSMPSGVPQVVIVADVADLTDR